MEKEQSPARDMEVDPTTEVEDEDPVVAEYDVYITPEMLQQQQQLYLMQYLNRRAEQTLTAKDNAVPTELRVKKDTGFVELDVPIDIYTNYNRITGVRWGEAVRKTKGFGQKAFGIASGFERNMPRTNTRAADGAPAPPVTADDDDNLEEYVTRFEDANEKGHVLNVQTYGGQIQPDDGKGPSYMLGTFRQNELHLTRLNGLVQLRTQFHHIDAGAQLEAVARRREKEAQEGAKPTEPKSFLPTVKKAGGDTAAELTQAFMKNAHVEPWSKLQYTDEDSQIAFDAYSDRLFLESTADAPKLKSVQNNEQFLDKMSAPSSGKGAKRNNAVKQETVEISDESDECDDN